MLGRDDIATISRRLVEEFEPPKKEEAWYWGLRTTSGTTSAPIVNLVLRKEIEWFYRAQRSVICLGSMGIRLHAAKNVRRDPVGGNRTLVLDGGDCATPLTPLLADFRPDMFVGFPSLILRAAAYLDLQTARGVQELHVVGEAVTAALEEILKQQFPNAVIRSMYVAAEFGVLSQVNCPYLSRGWYHPRSDVRIEISDADEDGTGNLLVTGMRNESIWVERYRIGDIGSVRQALCPCGQRQSFAVIGRRGHDYVKLAGAILRREEFDRALQKFTSVEDYRAEASTISLNGKLRGKVRLRLYSRSPREDADLGHAIAQELFVTPSRTLQELVESGDFLPLEIMWEQEPFPRKHKDIKLVQLQGEDGKGERH